MIWINRVGSVVCSRCGNHLEGVEAVFAGHAEAVALCWQDFEARAMKRRARPHGPCCLDNPANRGPTLSIHCNCPYERGVSICESDGSTRGTTTIGTRYGTTHPKGETTTRVRSEGESYSTCRSRTETCD
jgi:hypothetical protein